MNTTELINALVQDQAAPRWRLPAALRIGLAAGAVPAALAVLLWLGPRAGLLALLPTAPLLLKFATTLGLALCALGLTLRLARPDGTPGAWPWGLAAVALLLAGGVALELALAPAAEWGARLRGQNALACLILVPLLALPPLAGLLLALRQGAPRRPGLSGTLAGLAAGGVAAALYALHCVDDSPLFLAMWYGLGIGFTGLLGGLAGRIWLRW